MDARASEDAAFTMLHEASRGQDISSRYNALTLPEQRQVMGDMTAMKAQMPAQFGNVELFDKDNDGILDDASARVDKKTGNNIENVTYNDVYNPSGGDKHQAKGDREQARKPQHTDSGRSMNAEPTTRESVRDNRQEESQQLPTRNEISRDPFLRQADSLLRTASRGGDIYRQFSRMDPESQSNMLQAMELVQAAKPQDYGNIKLIASGNGTLADVRAMVMTRQGPHEVDALKTPSDIASERAQKTLDEGISRTVNIFGQEAVNSVFRGGRGPDFGDRVERRMRNEGHRVLRNETSRAARELPNTILGILGR